MRIGIPYEPADQPCTATSPQTVEQIIHLDYGILVRSGTRVRTRFPDEAHEAAGIRLADRTRIWSCKIVVNASTPAEGHLALMNQDVILIYRLDPARHPELPKLLHERGITTLTLDIIPRISRAQSLGVPSSQANLADYRVVIETASCLGKLFSGQVTAAGKSPPATVYVIGAGVTGLSTIGAAYLLGAQVRGPDMHPEAADRVHSMGAQLAPLPSTQEVSFDDYTKRMSTDQANAAHASYAQQATESDIVITITSIPGRHAPMLLDRSAIEAMRPGPVIIDMMAAASGNTGLTVSDRVVTTNDDVTIVGHTNLAGVLPAQAAQLYGCNITNLLSLVTPNKDGTLTLDLDGRVVRVITVTRGGELL